MKQHLVNILFQQYKSDKALMVLEGFERDNKRSAQYWKLFSEAFVDNWDIAIDLMGFPPEDELERDWLFDTYWEVFCKTYQGEEEVKLALSVYIDWLYEQLHAVNAGKLPSFIQGKWILN